MFHTPETYRIKSGPYGSTQAYGNNGAFLIPVQQFKKYLRVVASDSQGWEHVSVSANNRFPTWPEMCHIKALFWDDEDIAIQYHQAKSDYINNHPHCLHFWRPSGIALPTPDPILIGTK